MAEQPASAHEPPDRVSEARKAHDRGWVLTPLRGKIPRLKGWQSRPRPPIEDVERWAKANNVGLRTGTVSGVVVIDDDSADGSAASALNLPKTVSVVTGSGKSHFYFRAPDFTVGNSVKTLAPGIDVRGDGGQVVFVGSLHPDTQLAYSWQAGCSPDEVDLAELPAHILDVLRPKPKLATTKENTAERTEGRKRAYVEAALVSATDNVRTAANGTRNDTLNKEAFGLGQLVGAGVLDMATALSSLIDAAIAAGLPESEAKATAQSGVNAGAKDPRDMSSLLPKADAHHDSEANATAGEPLDKDLRPKVKIHSGLLHLAVDKAERILRKVTPPLFYQRGTTLARIVEISAVFRAIGQPSKNAMILEVDATYLVDRLTRLINWQRLDKRAGEYVMVDCPERVARSLLARAGDWQLPRLVGIIQTPTLRIDGSLLTDPGYDARSGLYLAASDCRFPEIPDKPTKSTAEDALEYLLLPLKDFAFLDHADRSVAVAAILTALIRPSLRTSPMFVFSAPKMGSGKSLLADIVSLIATGRPAAVMAQGQDENEDKKRMLAILMEGDPVVVIDNIDKPFGSSALCSILTQTTYRDRVLGKSETMTLPTTNTTWLATGNNIEFVGDITTRVVPCYLDPECERPEERKFDVNLHKFVPEHRGDLVAAGLTILRGYNLDGRPSQDLPVFGRFEEWSDWVRSALVWLGMPDPCATRRRVETTDPVRLVLATVLRELARCFGNDQFTAGEVLDRHDDTLNTAIAMITVDDKAGPPTAQRLGMFFQRHDRRLEGGLRLLRDGARHGTTLWRVEHGR